jgi:hypothetical protein
MREREREQKQKRGHSVKSFFSHSRFLGYLLALQDEILQRFDLGTTRGRIALELGLRSAKSAEGPAFFGVFESSDFLGGWS